MGNLPSNSGYKKGFYLRNLLVILLLFVTLHADDEYQLGEGVQVGSLPLYIGGYFSADYRNIDDENRYRLDDLALLAYGNYDKFSYMTEIEYKDFYVQTRNPQSKNTPSSSQDRTLYIERLYLDYNLDESFSFRVGKYNSPIGFWNLLPINVLKETTSSPMLITMIYPTFTTGLGAAYSNYGSGEFKVNLLFQNNNDIDADYNNYKTDKHYGVGISYELNNYTLKMNGGYFHKNDNKVELDSLYYLLLSAKYETDDYQILSELGRQESKDVVTTSHAAYIQGLYRFTQQHIGIVRVESYETNAKRALDEEMTVIGYTYRPLYPIAIKSEYQIHKDQDMNQILLSLSVLF